jgi:hypothetical protein
LSFAAALRPGWLLRHPRDERAENNGGIKPSGTRGTRGENDAPPPLNMQSEVGRVCFGSAPWQEPAWTTESLFEYRLRLRQHQRLRYDDETGGAHTLFIE